MNQNVYFISDVHLHLYDSPDEKVKRERLFEFLAEVRRNKGALYILGDLFDFWFEYRTVIPGFYLPVLCQLRETVRAGCELHFLGGNHDYWVGSFFANTLGITVHYNPIDILISGHRFHLTHGDGILRSDRGYRLMRYFFRNPLCIRLFGLLHPDLAYRLGAKISGKSRRLTQRSSSLEASDRQEIIAYGLTQLAAGAEFVITGHFHLPTEFRTERGTIFNLGDWMKYFSFAYFNGQNMRLCYWPQNRSDQE
ncbi:MAG: UDP-2,3-diacylglucosamine diphosphatase [Candidatus Marinimicrobia bacterium]|nr:UDP-2,3-diacylglucosamine diphosphatase [Candidatus Neomarinimicrobiota bacterium]MDD5062592.1 UDP-2,3-diacylglucosamine diphosphatase [Candidatus Neomarinimicrobiota bacterium]MDD5230392.1 UDP-2,3-diacylglucosamine diphosphatase [Candidatus Neomarinimicrobiota bacterium]MDD5539567.1 UDP-2,3-diacylglucosamine diphosphatase [Candidatus Neomarinimicrobiota bacterium]